MTLADLSSGTFTGADLRTRVNAALTDLRAARPTAYGADADGGDDTAAFQATIDASGRRALQVTGSHVIGDLALSTTSMDGHGVGQLTAASGAAYVLGLGRDSTNGWRHRTVRDIYIDGNAKASDGIDFNAGGTSDELAGRWTLDSVFVKSCAKGIRKRFGNIGNVFRSVSVKSCDFGYHSVAQASPAMHGGADLWDGGEISSCALAALYIDSPTTGTGGTTLRNLIIESNPGFGLFVKSWASSLVPLVLESVWFEGNATSGSVTIDGVSYTPQDIYIKDAALVIIRGSQIRKATFDNSRVLLDGCFFDDQTAITLANSPNVRIINANVDGLKSAVTVETLMRSARASGSFAAAHGAPARSHSIRSLSGSGVVASSRSFGTTATSGTTVPSNETLTSTQVEDGQFDPYAAEYSQGSGTSVFLAGGSITSGKWYAYSFDWKQVSGAPSSVSLINGVSLASAVPLLGLPAGQWGTFGGVARAASTGTIAIRVNSNTGAHVFRVRDYQLVQFDTEAEALAYYNSRAVVHA